MVRTRPIALGVLAAVIGVLLAGLSPATSVAFAQAPDIAKARQEGRVVWYTAITTKMAEIFKQMFEESYSGIKVDIVRAGSERLMSRLVQEYKNGVAGADVLLTSEQSVGMALKNEMALVAYAPKGAESLGPEWRDKDGFWHAWTYQVSIPAYNTKLVKTDDAPKTWKELAAPKWSGKLVLGHPNYSGGVAASIPALVDQLGWKWFEGLRDNRVMIVQSGLDAQRLVEAGERPVGVMAADWQWFQSKAAGNPVEAIYPPEGAPVSLFTLMLIKNSSHPNAAKLFMDFLYRQDVQQRAVEPDSALLAVSPKVTYPKGRKTPREFKALFPDPETMLLRVKDGKERFGAIFAR